jgi:hypothetical protein
VQAGRVTPSDADLSGNGAGVIDFNAEVPHRALALGVTEKQLDRPEVFVVAFPRSAKTLLK